MRGEVLKWFLFHLSYLSLTQCQYQFPEDFLFGVASSAYQIEGAWDADGKGPNVFDNLFHTNPGIVADSKNGDIACNSYYKYQEDVQMIRYLGAKYYRFSVSWARILPGGFSNNVSQAGVDYYNSLIDDLLANGIQPAITIFHWDTPYMFSTLGSFANQHIVDHFGEYSRLLFQLFGDRVKLWFTINEPKVVCMEFHHYMGNLIWPYANGVLEYECGHTILLAHARAYHIYDEEFRPTQQGRITIVLNFEWEEAASDSPEDQEAAETRRQFEFGWFANPIFRGNYPSIMRSRISQRSQLEGYPHTRLPQFSLAEMKYVFGTADFMAINHYSSWLVQAAEEPPIGRPTFLTDMGTTRHQDPSWPASEINPEFRVVPWGLRHLLNWVKRTYGNPEMMITENGYTDGGTTLDDQERVNYYRTYLNASLHAIHEDGVRLTGYFAWSIMDNFEWFWGYTAKYGIYHVDFDHDDRPRTPKQSAEYYKTVIATRQV